MPEEAVLATVLDAAGTEAAGAAFASEFAPWAASAAEGGANFVGPLAEGVGIPGASDLSPWAASSAEGGANFTGPPTAENNALGQNALSQSLSQFAKGIPAGSSLQSGETGAFDQAGSAGSGIPGSGSSSQDLFERLKSNPWKTLNDIVNPDGKNGASPATWASSLYSGYKGMQLSDQLKKLSSMALNGSDPWGTSGGRAGAAATLNANIQDPSLYYNTPEYKALQQATMRSGAAGGFNGSGNLLASLQAAGSSGRTSYLSSLAGLAGANQNPAASYTAAGSLLGAGGDVMSRALASYAYPTGINNASTNGITPQVLAALLANSNRSGAA